MTLPTNPKFVAADPKGNKVTYQKDVDGRVRCTVPGDPTLWDADTFVLGEFSDAELMAVVQARGGCLTPSDDVLEAAAQLLWKALCPVGAQWSELTLRTRETHRNAIRLISSLLLADKEREVEELQSAFAECHRDMRTAESRVAALEAALEAHDGCLVTNKCPACAAIPEVR